MQTISVDELKNKVLNSNPVNIIDVRTEEETAMGIIPGAKTIPMNQIPDHLSDFSENEKYYIVCKSGGRSAQVTNYLEQNGLDAVNVEGGMDDWGDEGLQIDRI